MFFRKKKAAPPPPKPVAKKALKPKEPKVDKIVEALVRRPTTAASSGGPVHTRIQTAEGRRRAQSKKA